MVDVVEVGDVVEVVGLWGALVVLVEDTIDAGVLVVGGEVVGGVVVGVAIVGGLVAALDGRIRLGIVVLGEVVVEGAGSTAVDGASLETGTGIVGGGAATGALVVGGEITSRTR